MASGLQLGGLEPVGPPITPRPRPQQIWVHSCCSKDKLERALSDPNVTAIEADIMMGGTPMVGGGGGSYSSSDDEPGRFPIMAHPPVISRKPPASDLTFTEFLERCMADGARHLKLDFKELAAVEPCLVQLAARWRQLNANGQAIYLNADVLPGPNCRKRVEIPASSFVPLCRKWCPFAYLSLGWRVWAIGPEEAYSEHDTLEMARVVGEYGLPGSSVVFAASLRLAERACPAISSLLKQVPDSQMLLWTGYGEAPVPAALRARVQRQLSSMGVGERFGFDAARRRAL